MKSPRIRHWAAIVVLPVAPRSRGRCHMSSDKAVPPQHSQEESKPNKGRGGHGETSTANVTNNTAPRASG